MIVKARSVRPISGLPSMVNAQVLKSVYDKILFFMVYDDVLDEGDYLSSCHLSARKLSDGSITNSVLASQTGTLLNGTATGGSTTTIIDTATNFVSVGVIPGDTVLNSTKGWLARIKRIYKTTNPYDTLEFDAAISAAAMSDAYKFRFAKATLIAGTDGESYTVSFDTITNRGVQLQDQILLNVVGADRSAD